MSINLGDNLFDSNDVRAWVEAEPRIYTRREMEFYLAQLQALSFQRLRWSSAPYGSVHLEGDNPWSKLPSACPPKQGPQNPQVTRHTLLALDVRSADSLGRWQVSPGFLRWIERWYFSRDGEHFAPTVSSTTLWRTQRLSSHNER